jgi:PKD repeat protein
MIYEAYAPNIGLVGENIQFNSSLEPLTGTPPYSYNWNFGDQKSSNERNPIHAYTKAGDYTYTLTVTDAEGATESLSDNITISDESGNGNDDTRMILLLAIILIIIVIGVVVIVWIIRRR